MGKKRESQPLPHLPLVRDPLLPRRPGGNAGNAWEVAHPSSAFLCLLEDIALRSIVLIYFFDFYFSRSVWKHVPVLFTFFIPTHPLCPFSAPLTPKMYACVSIYPDLPRVTRAHRLRRPALDPREPWGHIARFQEWGPSALGITSGIFPLTTDWKSESNHYQGRYNSEEPGESLGQDPSRSSLLVSERLFRNPSPFSSSELYISLLL